MGAHWVSEPLRPGEYTITAEADARLAHIIHGTPGDAGTAHPLWGFVAPRAGIGTSLPELCRLAGSDIEAGPLLGAIDLEFAGPIELDVRYEVTGETLGIERKQGRSGTFDLFTFRERLGDVVSLTSTFVLPK